MMPEEALLKFVPKDKFDTATAEAAAAAGYPAVAPVLPDLLAWMQDYNWPVAQILGPFLARIGIALLPHVRNVLRGDDVIWQRWILACVVGESEELSRALASELERLAVAAQHSEGEDVDEVARSIIDRYRLR